MPQDTVRSVYGFEKSTECTLECAERNVTVHATLFITVNQHFIMASLFFKNYIYYTNFQNLYNLVEVFQAFQ